MESRRSWLGRSAQAVPQLHQHLELGRVLVPVRVGERHRTLDEQPLILGAGILHPVKAVLEDFRRRPLPLHIAEQGGPVVRSEEHTSEHQSLMRLSYAGFCLKKKKNK